jgi:hypothetical protein
MRHSARTVARRFTMHNTSCTMHHHTPYNTIHPDPPESAEASRPRTVELAAQARKQLALQSTYPECLVPNQPNNKSSAEHSRAHSSKRFRSLIKTYLDADHHEYARVCYARGHAVRWSAIWYRCIRGSRGFWRCLLCMHAHCVGGWVCVMCMCMCGRQ